MKKQNTTLRFLPQTGVTEGTKMKRKIKRCNCENCYTKDEYINNWWRGFNGMLAIIYLCLSLCVLTYLINTPYWSVKFAFTWVGTLIFHAGLFSALVYLAIPPKKK